MIWAPIQRERLVDGVILVEEWLCVCGRDYQPSPCPCGVWMSVCRLCENGPITGEDEKRGICDEH